MSEICYHLGNVLNVITDRKLAMNTTADPTHVAYYTADVVEYSDYYPFGMKYPNRHGRSGSKYRYSFQSQESNDEMMGEDNIANFEFRMNDVRLGRFFAVDPLTKSYPWNSPYSFSENTVINAIEMEGLEKVHVYNVSYNSKGERQSSFSHTYTDNKLKTDIREVRYHDDGGKVSATKYIDKKSGGSVTYHSGGNKSKEVNEVRELFNPKEIVNDSPTFQETPAKTKLGIDKIIDEQWNKGNYGKAVGFILNKEDASLEGKKGAIKVAGILDGASNIAGYIPGGGMVSLITGSFSAYMKSAVDFSEGNPNAVFNTGVRAVNQGLGELIGNKINKIDVLSKGEKAIFDGNVNFGAGMVEDKLTEKKSNKK